MVDRSTILQVFGSLMQQPQYLSEVDKYVLTPDDFYDKLDKYIFTAIDNLYRDGAKLIQPIDVENFLSVNAAAATTFKQQNGIEYLQDAVYLTEKQNFPYYYKKLKKFNLLERLKRKGISTDDLYIDDLLNPKAMEINKNFEDLELSDIVDSVKKKVALIESEFVENGEVESWDIIEDIDDLVASFGVGDTIGLPINGDCISQIINGAELGALTIRSAATGVGKAIPNYTVIPTPNGNRRVDEIKIGDYLWGDDGKPTKVIKIHPQPEQKEIYRVYFKDGRVAECCKEHLWGYFNHYAQDKKHINVADTQTLMKSKINGTKGYHYSVPLNQPIQYEQKELYPSPYAMGALLGDGSFRYQDNQKALTMSGIDEEIIKLTADGLKCNYEKNNANNCTWTFKLINKTQNRRNLWVEEALKNYPELWNKKSNEKFIPEEYLYSSVEQRYELLQGLLDTDGTIDKTRGRTRFDSNSFKLIKQVQQLCWSLGFIATIHEDRHKSTSVVYYLNIQCTKKDKVNLFKLTRKKQIAEAITKDGRREERRDNNAIIKIEPTGIYTDMTCFTVDNSSHLFLMNDYIVTHNTRYAVGDACKLAFPFTYNELTCKWENTGFNESVLFVCTEQKPEQIEKMILAYLTGINESKFKYGYFTDDEQKRIKQAIHIIKSYPNFHLMRMPDPNVELIKVLVREQVILYNVKYCFFDYIFASGGLYKEFRGNNLRTDEALLLLSTALKDIAIEQNISVFTATQLNAKGDDNKDIRNESALSGSRAIANKCDNGLIVARPSKEELDFLSQENFTIPNRVTDVYKSRSSQWSYVRVWSFFDAGTCRNTDLFVTDNRMNVIEDFHNNEFNNTWEIDERILDFMKGLNDD